MCSAGSSGSASNLRSIRCVRALSRYAVAKPVQRQTVRYNHLVSYFQQHSFHSLTTKSVAVGVQVLYTLYASIVIVMSFKTSNLVQRIFHVICSGLCNNRTVYVMFSDTVINSVSVVNVSYCVRGGHIPAHWPWPTSQNALSRQVNGSGKVILGTHPESDQHQNCTCSRGSPPAPTHQLWW